MKWTWGGMYLCFMAYMGAVGAGSSRRIDNCGDCTVPHNVTVSVLERPPNGRGSIERLTDTPVETLHHAVDLGHGAVMRCLMSSSAHRWSNLWLPVALCSRAANDPSAYFFTVGGQWPCDLYRACIVLRFQKGLGICCCFSA